MTQRTGGWEFSNPAPAALCLKAGSFRSPGLLFNLDQLGSGESYEAVAGTVSWEAANSVGFLGATGDGFPSD